MTSSKFTALMILLLFGAAGCQSAIAPGESAGSGPSQITENIVWPAPPASPRVRYVRSISTPADVGIKRSFFGKLADVVTGRQQPRLMRPTGVTEQDGVLYVADPGAQTLWIFDSIRQGSVAVRQLGEDSLVSPVALTPAGEDRVFLADSMLRKIFEVDRQGKLLESFSDTGLKRPAALAYNRRADRLYVADSAGQAVFVFTGAGKRVAVWGRSGVEGREFNFPSYLTLSGDDLIVTDALNYRVEAFAPNGKVLWRVGHHGDGSGDFAAPKGIATDREGHVYVVDALFDAVQIFDQDGTFLLSFGERGTAPGKFSLPTGAFMNARQQMYVADSYNQRIQVFEFLGPPAAQPVASKNSSKEESRAD